MGNRGHPGLGGAVARGADGRRRRGILIAVELPSEMLFVFTILMTKMKTNNGYESTTDLGWPGAKRRQLPEPTA